MGDFNSTLFRRLAEAEESTMTRGGKLEDTWTPAQLESIERLRKLIWKVLMLRASQMMVKEGQDALQEKFRKATTNIELTFADYSASRGDQSEHQRAEGSPEVFDKNFPLEIATENVKIGVKISPYDSIKEIPQESVWWCLQIIITPLVCPDPR